VAPVLGLVPDPLATAVQDLGGDLLAGVGGQIVQREGLGEGVVEERVVDAVGREVFAALIGLLLVAHRHPDVGVERVGARRGLDGVADKDGTGARVELVAGRRCDNHLDAGERSEDREAARHVVTVAHVGDAQAVELAEGLFESHQVGERLAGVVLGGQHVEDGDLTVARELLDRRLRARADPDRVPPQADHPGAPWQELRYERQVEVKHAQVDDALRRIGHLDGFTLHDIVPAEQQWRYRNKLEYSFGTGEDGKLELGFHAPGSWEHIVAFDDCLLASVPANATRQAALDWCRSQGLTAFDRRARTGLLRNLVVREGRRTGEIQVRLVTAPGEIDTDSLAQALPVQSLLWTTTDALAETSQGGDTELVAGSAQIAEEICGLRIGISPDAFFQTNTEMAERLYGLVAQSAELHGWERVFDLFCGTGTIGLSLAGRAGTVHGLEIVPQAVADAIANASENQIGNARFYAGDVRLALRELTQLAGGRPDLLIVDPPRAGLSQKIVRRIIETGPKRIVYVSCNPTTLAPNAVQLAEAGWRLQDVTPLDMFPQTPHIECVATLVR
jgi:23S rRNA (uracil1939-C5)-methyltransferase